MNEISPTANAAKTVVSTLLDTSELVALEVGVEARRAGGPVRHGGRGGRQRDQGDQDRERAPHVRSWRRGRTFSRKKASSTGPRSVDAMRPRRSITSVSGTPVTPNSFWRAPGPSRRLG